MNSNQQQSAEQTGLLKMSSGLRDDAWHWLDTDVSLLSSEKLREILQLDLLAQQPAEVQAMQAVRMELEKRLQQFKVSA